MRANPPANATPNTIMSGEVAVRGHVHGSSDVTVNGRLDGSVELDATLTVGPDAVVKADLRVKRADVYGVVLGSIVASQDVTLRSTARVVADVFAPSLIMEDGARFKGWVRDPQEAPAKGSGSSALVQQGPAAPPPPLRHATVVPSLPPLPPRPLPRGAAPTPPLSPPTPAKPVVRAETPAAPAPVREPRRRKAAAPAPVEPAVTPPETETAKPVSKARTQPPPLSPPEPRALPGRGTSIALRRR